MEEWEVRFELRRPLAALPRPRRAALSRVGAGYRSIGRRREREGCSVLQLGLEGRGVFRDAQGERAVDPGQAFLCRVDDPAVDYGHPGGATPWRFVFLAFFGAEAVVEALVARDGPLRRLGPEHPAARQLHALQRYAGGRALSAGAGALLVQNLLAALADDAKPLGASQRLVAAAQDRLRTEPARLYTVAQLAAELAVSREHLTRAFVHELGESPRDWIAREKMRLACEQLRDPDRPVAAIAAALGYPDASRFDKVFKRTLGCSPSAWRHGRFVPLY